jgi:hypothetical protein
LNGVACAEGKGRLAAADGRRGAVLELVLVVLPIERMERVDGRPAGVGLAAATTGEGVAGFGGARDDELARALGPLLERRKTLQVERAIGLPPKVSGSTARVRAMHARRSSLRL